MFVWNASSISSSFAILRTVCTLFEYRRIILVREITGKIPQQLVAAVFRTLALYLCNVLHSHLLKSMSEETGSAQLC